MADTEWDPDAYEQFAFVHERAESLIDLLEPAPGDRVLDVGCGTGELTAEIAETASARGIDADESMIARARA